MYPHHQTTIDRLIEQFEPDPNFSALLIAGSIAKGWAKADSDVDIILVATDEEYARRVSANQFHYFNPDLCDYPGGYVDGKIVDLAFLVDVAEHGSEPARAAFVGAWIAYSRLPDLDELLRRIPVYPEHERQEKIRSFYAQLEALHWYVGEAEKRRDPYLMAHVVADLVLFGGRLILAHNRVLYPYHKWFVTVLSAAPAKPDNLIALAERLLAEPNKAHAEAFYDAVASFTDWDKPPEGWPVRFMHDSEWTWRNGRSPIADW